MPYPTSAPHRILEQMKSITVAAALHTAFGQTKPFSVRHYRNRSTQKTERPAIAFRLVNIELDPDRQQIHSQDEICWRMTVDVVVDLELAPEADVAGEDPTGWNQLAGTAAAVMNLLLPPGSAIRTLVDDVLPGDIDPDEDSTPDEGRLAQSVIVLYRTLWSDLNYLLSPEENA